jgi:excisionase family DNA binding protein
MTPPDDGPLPAGLVLIGLADLESLSRSLRSAPESATADRTEAANGLGHHERGRRRTLPGHQPRSHAYDLIRAGTIPHLKLGRRIIIPRRELDAMITRGVNKQASPASDTPDTPSVAR